MLFPALTVPTDKFILKDYNRSKMLEEMIEIALRGKVSRLLK